MILILIKPLGALLTDSTSGLKGMCLHISSAISLGEIGPIDIKLIQ